MKKKLHELIEMAKRGEKFEAARTTGSDWYIQDTFLIKPGNYWFSVDIITDWTVRMKREPRVVWLAQRADDSLYEQWFDSSEDSKHFGKPIKFIEVIEDEP